MKTVIVGIGSYGYGWYKQVKAHPAGLRIAVVDREPRAALLLAQGTPFYTDLAEALDREKPDFVLNITPPAEHTAINHQAFDRRIPVLCEKPIAESYDEAIGVVDRSVRENIPFMIAENYRRGPAFRKAHALLRSGAVGDLTAVYVQFFKETQFDKEYLQRMAEPLLLDVTVHHMDLARYLTGQEGARVLARSFRPLGSRYPGCSAANIHLEMQNGTVISYAGSLSSREPETGWAGAWRLQGTGGVMLLDENSIRIFRSGQVETIQDFSGVDTSTVLDEFLRALAEDRPPETSGADYLGTQKLIHYALESIRLEQVVSIPQG